MRTYHRFIELVTVIVVIVPLVTLHAIVVAIRTVWTIAGDTL
jgi:hypothetical protein